MAKQLIYNGGLGPATIKCGGTLFKKGVPVPVDNEPGPIDKKTKKPGPSIADRLLAKGCFKVASAAEIAAANAPATEAPAADPAKKDTAENPAGKKEK